jgi:hypothetical protein
VASWSLEEVQNPTIGVPACAYVDHETALQNENHLRNTVCTMQGDANKLTLMHPFPAAIRPSPSCPLASIINSYRRFLLSISCF